MAAAVVIHNIQNNKSKATFNLKIAEVRNSFEKCSVSYVFQVQRIQKSVQKVV